MKVSIAMLSLLLLGPAAFDAQQLSAPLDPKRAIAALREARNRMEAMDEETGPAFERFLEADGKLRAILFGYACHNTTLSFYQFCGDYAGYAQEYLEAAHPGTVALFVTGCGADQNPYPRGELTLCQQHGRALANAVETALLPTPKPVIGVPEWRSRSPPRRQCSFSA